jgi:hypothetical protein
VVGSPAAASAGGTVEIHKKSSNELCLTASSRLVIDLLKTLQEE